MFALNLLGCFLLFVDVDNRPSWKQFVISAAWVNNCLWFSPVDSPRHHFLYMLIYGRRPWCAMHKSLRFLFNVTHPCMTAPLTAISEGRYEPPVYCCLFAKSVILFKLNTFEFCSLQPPPPSAQPPVAQCTVPQLIINWGKIIVGQNQRICSVRFFKGDDIVGFVITSAN